LLTARTQSLFVSLPAPPRAAFEVALVLMVVLGPHYVPPGPAAAVLSVTLLLCALLAVEPWAPRHGGGVARMVVLVGTVLSIVVPTWAARPDLAFARQHLFAALALRGVAVMGLVFLIARADGQPLSALGIAREHAGRDVLRAIPAMLGAFLADVLAAAPIAALKLAGGAKLVEKEAATRQDVLHHFTDSISVGGFALAMLFTATFEEVVFRAFLLPRVRDLLPSWPLTVLAVNVVFGLGHLYEGTLAAFQVTVLGVYFSIVYLFTGRLATVALAHALFNTAIFAAASKLL
jgi:membrane protease YdiL (CAAX protease family)